MSAETNLRDAQSVLEIIGLPRPQLNERSALTLLSLMNLRPDYAWSDAENPLMGITPMMDWMRTHYGKEYAPNTRETIRRQTMHQFVEAGVALYNPDDPKRPVNSPKAVYQIEPHFLAALRTFGTDAWSAEIADFLKRQRSLVDRYAKEREQNRIPVTLTNGKTLTLSAGDHSELIRDIIEDFAARFVPGGILVYAGDTGEKWGYFDEGLLADLKVDPGSHGKMPDVIIYDRKRNWLVLIESVTSHGPVDGKRHDELTRLFSSSAAGLVYVTAFPSRAIMGKYLSEIAWETEVWVADSPSHLIHFNGDRYLGPHNI
ncbi:hypothetical protein AEAC466_20320 [Asticcacaulis sp. AC466]|uniref:BsuBI/PstI family type II restriction endonuclease n=1 Tax=Asticcacaulis sp. AC466 TaxID=1282362 RepID=UPI0003C3C5EB|nr:BsuBI/PstI family type II restriction endonuclease [Asticcacaulis sp. AC466]ESQ81770.1 hypothetical protein AEAC466_20320 [Asticcacaulis sp. AC466]